MEQDDEWLRPRRRRGARLFVPRLLRASQAISWWPRLWCFYNSTHQIRWDMVVYSKLSDTELIHLLSSEDHSAYTEIYNRYFQLIYTHVYKKLQDKEQARDITQDVFTYLWFKREKTSQVNDLAAYLFTSARNKVFDLYAHGKVQEKHYNSLLHFLNSNSILPTDHLTRERDFQAYIDKQIAELPPKMRTIFELSRKEQLSYREIAEQLETTENNVSKQVNKAIKVLRTRFGLFFFTLF